jgi:ketosteroid isomerase-like protein
MADLSSKNLQIIQNIYSAFSVGNLDAFCTDISPNIIWIECKSFPAPGTFRSAQEILEKMAGVMQRDWEGFNWELDYIVDGGDDIVSIGTYRAKNRETGKNFEARGMHMWHLTDGKIDRFEGVCDTHLMQNAAR